MTNQISSYEQQAELNEISPEARMEGINAVISQVKTGQTAGLLWAMVLIPLVFGFVSYILYQKFYKLDEAKYDEICAELEVKKRSRKSGSSYSAWHWSFWGF